MFDPARLTWRVWRAAAKAVRLNLTAEGQFWVESRWSDVVGGKLDPSGTAGACHHLHRLHHGPDEDGLNRELGMRPVCD